ARTISQDTPCCSKAAVTWEISNSHEEGAGEAFKVQLIARALSDICMLLCAKACKAANDEPRIRPAYRSIDTRQNNGMFMGSACAAQCVPIPQRHSSPAPKGLALALHRVC